MNAESRRLGLDSDTAWTRTPPGLGHPPGGIPDSNPPCFAPSAARSGKNHRPVIESPPVRSHLPLFALGLAAVGCQLVIGDLEPMTAVAEPDAADAKPSDAQPPADVGPDATPPPDATLDAAALRDGAPDARPIDAVAAPRLDAATPANDSEPSDAGATLSGTWRFSGLRADGASDLVAFSARLEVIDDGVRMLTDDGTPLWDDVAFEPHPIHGDLWSINLHPLGGRSIGVLDVETGVGSFVNDPSLGYRIGTFVLLARESEVRSPLPERLHYGFSLDFGEVRTDEHGRLATRGDMIELSERFQVGADPPGPRTMQRANETFGRHRLFSEGDPISFAVTTTSSGDGIIGTVDLGPDDVGIIAGWRAGESTPPGHTLFCGGFGIDDDGTLITAWDVATVVDARTIRWQDGDRVTRGDDDGFETLTGTLSVVRGTGARLFAAAEGRLWFVVPFDGASTLERGFALCIQLARAM